VIRLALRVRREDAELTLAELLALAPSGVEEIEIDDSLIEFAVYGAPGELPELPNLRAAAGSAFVEVSTSELPDDWSERWKRFHQPIVVPAPLASSSVDRAPVELGEGADGHTDSVPSLRVRPPWEPSMDLPNTREIVIDPGQAFGTGAHHTTRMCLELLLQLASHEVARGPVIDLGCGSGVLAIAAAHLGFAPVLGLDHESESVQATQDNARANGVPVRGLRCDLRRQPLPPIQDGPEGRPPPLLLLANLVRPLLLDLAGSLLEPPAHLIASGLLREEADEALAAFHSSLGLRECQRLHSGEWAALWLSAGL
jgi:ribosomal protein L11 methyltransferase